MPEASARQRHAAFAPGRVALLDGLRAVAFSGIGKHAAVLLHGLVRRQHHIKQLRRRSRVAFCLLAIEDVRALAADPRFRFN
jgi:hypothetical protein